MDVAFVDAVLAAGRAVVEEVVDVTAGFVGSFVVEGLASAAVGLDAALEEVVAGLVVVVVVVGFAVVVGRSVVLAGRVVVVVVVAGRVVVEDVAGRVVVVVDGRAVEVEGREAL